MKTLVLMRHAHAGNAPGRSDEDRPLTPAGRHEAAGAGAWLRRGGLRPDLVLCSPAVRAEQTAGALGFDGTAVSTDPELYLATAQTILERIRLVADTVGVLLVVGHNPGMQSLVTLLGLPADHGPEARFPTAALAVVRSPAGSWASLRPDDAEVVTVEPRPR